MILKIDNPIKKVITLSDDNNNVYKTYYGYTSGKFYPSGTSGVLNTPCLKILSNTLSNIPDGVYTVEVSIPNAIPINIGITTVDNIVADNAFGITPDPSGSGYSVGDILTINGSDLDGSGKGQLSFKVISTIKDGLLIIIGQDTYEVKWYDLIINASTPSSLADAQDLLNSLFSNALMD